MVETGDELDVDLMSGRIRNCTRGKEIHGAPLSPLVLKFAESGGMLAYYKIQKKI